MDHSGLTDCISCHLSSMPAQGHVVAQCSICHNTNGWTPASFDHNFPVNHENANGVCANCHPGGTTDWTCYTCHDQQETENHHAEKDIFNIANRCMECHPDGEND
jgi:hypothetical protein